MRAPMLPQHPDQYRWPGYTYLVATRIDLSRTRVLRRWQRVCGFNGVSGPDR
jgi:hypothetical protein